MIAMQDQLWCKTSWSWIEPMQIMRWNINMVIILKPKAQQNERRCWMKNSQTSNNSKNLQKSKTIARTTKKNQHKPLKHDEATTLLCAQLKTKMQHRESKDKLNIKKRKDNATTRNELHYKLKTFLHYGIHFCKCYVIHFWNDKGRQMIKSDSGQMMKIRAIRSYNL